MRLKKLTIYYGVGLGENAKFSISYLDACIPM